MNIVHKYTIWIVLGMVAMLLIIIWDRGIRSLPAGTSISCNRCNVILIDIDNFRADGLPCMGYSRNTTPNICALAKQGSLFRHNISQSFWTLPSMISTITSLYPSAHQFTDEDQVLNPTVTTMAEIFKSAGYTTQYEGTPLNFDIAYNNRAIKGFDSVKIQEETDTVSDWIKPWVESIRIARSQKQPFFIHYFSSKPHLPYVLPRGHVHIADLPKPSGFPEYQNETDAMYKEYISLHYRDIFTDQAIKDRHELFNNVENNTSEIFRFYMSIGEDTQEKYLKGRWRFFMSSYAGFINRRGEPGILYLRMLYDTVLRDVDALAGAVIQELQRSKLMHKTIIVITSAHGEEFGEHGVFSHEYGNYNSLIHTPLIIYVPGATPRIVDEVTQNIDILPTLTDLISVSPLLQFQGTSLVPLIEGQPSTQDRFAVGEFDGLRGASIQSKQWKLILSNINTATESSEFYDLVHDPKETRSIVKEETQRVADLTFRLKDILKKSRAKPYHSVLPGHPTQEEERLRERLRKEGYF